MGWRSVLFGFAAVVASGLGAWAQSASDPLQTPAAQATDIRQSTDTREVTPYQLPSRAQQDAVVLRPPEGTQPRYATMVAPTREESPPDQAPIPAPTTKVTVAPADAGQPAVEQPRYSTMLPPEKRVEQITVTGLRPSEDGLYRLGAGDKLRVTVFNETDLSGEYTIDGQGYVRLPLVGPVPAAGMTTLGLEGRIADAFVNGGYLLNPRVAVEITNYRPFYIIGEVTKPGEYAYVNSMTAPNAIALAGGFTERAVESSLWIRRLGDKKEREFEFDDTTRIYPGDVIRVDRTTYWSIMSLLAPLISPFSAIAYLLK